MSYKDAVLKDDIHQDVEEILVNIIKKHPIEMEERIDTLAKPLIVECACPGWQTRKWPLKRAYPTRLPPGYVEGGIRYAAVPCSIEEQANEIVQAVKAGCSAAHVHPRDPNDGIATTEVGTLSQVYNQIFAQTDVVTIQHTWKKDAEGLIDYVEDGKKMLEVGGGNRYFQGAVVLWPPGNSYSPNNTEAVQEAIRFMEANKIKPVHKLRSSYHVRHLWRVLIDTGVITQEPLVLVHDMGHPMGWPMDIDPWMPIDLVASIEQTKRRIPNSVIGVYSGYRNWLPITITAILCGVDMVRVGIEDCYYMYPHLDEVIKTNMECVQKIFDFCRLIGRKVATVEETRKILGITRTS
jgi:uncharacterized protein (DUF849 family)